MKSDLGAAVRQWQGSLSRLAASWEAMLEAQDHETHEVWWHHQTHRYAGSAYRVRYELWEAGVTHQYE